MIAAEEFSLRAAAFRRMRRWSRGRWESVRVRRDRNSKSIIKRRTLSAERHLTLKQGDYISIDGSAGEVFAGEADDRAVRNCSECWWIGPWMRRATPISRCAKTHELGG